MALEPVAVRPDAYLKSNSSLITLESNVMAVMDRKHQAISGCLPE